MPVGPANDSPAPGVNEVAAQGLRAGQRVPVPYYVKGLALGIPPYLVAIHLWTWILIVPGALATGGYDFRQVYAAAYMIRTGHGNELYDYNAQKEFQNALVSREDVALPFVSPAYEAWVLAPLSLLPFRSAYCAFLGLNLIALWLCFALLRPWMGNLRAIYPWLPGALFLGFLPVATALIEGQDSVLLTLLLTAAFVCLIRNRNFAAGILTGMGLFKFPIVLPIALLFLLWRRWNFLFGFALAAGALAATCVWLTGVPQTKLYAETLLSVAGITPIKTALALYPVNWKIMANVHGLVVGTVGKLLPPGQISAITILISLGVLLWTAWRGTRVKSAAALLLLAIPCSVLVSHHTNPHDLSVLILPVVIMLNVFLPFEEGKQPERAMARAAALVFVVPVMESYSLTHFYLGALAVLFLLWGTASAAQNQNLLSQAREFETQ